jgi:hypothetical protein
MKSDFENTSDIEKSIGRYNILTTFLTVSAILIGILTVLLTIQLDSRWFLLGLLPCIIAIMMITAFSNKRKKLRNLLQIRNDWGKDIFIKNRDLKTIRPFFDKMSSLNPNENAVDEQTWKDLNMDELYTRIDRSYTDPGEAVLYRMLREPLFNREELAGRGQVIRFFQNNRETREKIQMVLIGLGHQFVHNDIVNLLWRETNPITAMKWFYYFMAITAFISILPPLIFWSLPLVFIPVAMFFINLIIHYRFKRINEVETTSFPYLIRSIQAAKEISAVTDGEIEPYVNNLREEVKAAGGILKKVRFLFPVRSSPSDTGLLFEYVNIFFLFEVRDFYDITEEINRHINDLRQMYMTLGELDALISVASYRTSLPVYAEPEFAGDGIHLEVKDAKQPLLNNPVPFSVTIDKNIVLITGSNMGGKSTFLRTIGNNVLLAQTIATTVAAHYDAALFRIVTSISRTDDLVAGKSFYYVEAERILNTINSFSVKIPTLCIIDEMLSGTNSVERLHASKAIIQYLGKQNSLTIIATHDLELAGRLNGTCDFYHFTSSVDENGLKFDYLLKPGIATTRNAIELLKYLGYPKEITENAQQEE